MEGDDTNNTVVVKNIDIRTGAVMAAVTKNVEVGGARACVADTNACAVGANAVGTRANAVDACAADARRPCVAA